MKLLIAVDSATSTEVLVDAVGIRPWPEGTTAHVLSVVADMDVPEEVWREEGYKKSAVQREMETRGEQITPIAKRLEKIGISAEVVIARRRRATSDSILCAQVVFGSDFRPRARP